MTSHLPHRGSGDYLNSLFNRIVCHMHDLYDGTLSEQEAIEAARHWLGFCGRIELIKTEQENETEETKEASEP